MEDPDECTEFDVDVEAMSHALMTQAIMGVSKTFKGVSIKREPDAVRLDVDVVGGLSLEITQHYEELVAAALTEMNRQSLCLVDGTRMILSFQEA